MWTCVWLKCTYFFLKLWNVISSYFNPCYVLWGVFLLTTHSRTKHLCLTRFLYTTGTVMVAFSSSGENSTLHVFFHGNKLTTATNVSSHFSVFPSALAYLLFPALSLLAVGGILFLITNMQVQTTLANFKPSSAYSVDFFLLWLVFVIFWKLSVTVTSYDLRKCQAKSLE